MNLQEFLDFRNNCPICQHPLALAFHSERRQKIRYEEEQLIVIFPLDSLNKHQSDYKVGYSFGLKDNSFRIEFYSYEEVRMEKESPSFLIDRFRKLNDNLADYKMYKHCHNCNRYNYASQYLKIDFSKATVGEFNINTEFFILSKEVWSGVKVYKMLNYYDSKETWINYGKVKDIPKLQPVVFGTSLELPNNLRTGIIPFTSHDEVVNRLDKLILFS